MNSHDIYWGASVQKPSGDSLSRPLGCVSGSILAGRADILAITNMVLWKLSPLYCRSVITGMSTSVTAGERTYLTGNADFGTVQRVSFLGLKLAPVVKTDGNITIGLAGTRALQQVVPVSTGCNLLNEAVVVPLDVRMVGMDKLTAAGVPAATQALMFSNWRTLLTAEQKLVYADHWDSVIKNSSLEDQAAFVASMVDLLTSLPPPPPPR